MWETTGMRHIKVLGITGGVGAGKSTLLAYLNEKYRADVLQLDAAAHDLMEPGRACYGPVIDAFGRDILNEDGSINRAALYAKTFRDADRVRELNAIVHPRVKEFVRAWIKQKREETDAPFLVLEAALLLEDHYEQICDEIWFIYVNDEVRKKRLAASRGYTPEKTEQILKNQQSEAEFRAACQWTVDNSSDFLEDTYEQIDRGLREHGFV